MVPSPRSDDTSARRSPGRVRFRPPVGERCMSDSETQRGDDVKAREREKLDIGDDHPEDRDIRPRHREQADGLDVGDPHPAGRDTAKSQ
jgi:hypothetical protein